MRLYSLDQIVKSKLLQAGYSIHWYLQFLKYASDAVRELTFDTLKTVETIKLTVNSYGAVTIPCSYVDLVRIGPAYSDFLQPMAKRDNLNRLNNFDSGGNKIPYTTPTDDTGTGEAAYRSGFLGINNVFYGGWFGISGGTDQNSYKVLRERGEIQLSGYSGTEIILEFIGDGSDCNSATQVHPYAMATIEAYILWQMKLHNRSYSDGERANAERAFIKEHKRLRARLNGMTIDDLRRVMNNNYTGSIRG